MFKPKHFNLKELVSPLAYEKIPERVLWRRFPEVLLRDLDRLRERYGPAYINTWGLSNPNVLGEMFKYSGFHLDGEYNRGLGSGHRYFNAMDMKFTKVSAEEVREDLLGFEPAQNAYLPQIEAFPGITELEYGITWFHVAWDTNTESKVLVYKP